MKFKNRIVNDFIFFKRKAQQLEFLSRSSLLEEITPPFIVKRAMSYIMLIFFVFVCWATVYDVNELVKSPGVVIPSGKTRAIQHLEGGIVSEIYVDEGAFVDESTPLVLLENKSISAEYEKLKERGLMFQSQVKRLEIILKEESAGGKDPLDRLSGVDARMLVAMKESFDNDHNVLKRQLEQKIDELRIMKDRTKNAFKAYELSSEELAHHKKLFKKQLIGKSEYLNSQREKGRQWANYSQLNKTQEQLLTAIREFKTRLLSLESNVKEKYFRELEDLRNKNAENDQNILKVEDQIERLSIRSPVKGIVNQMSLHTIGGVVIPGRPIMEIVPTSEELVVELKVGPENIGQIEIGQKVIVKVTSYDYGRFGSIDGSVILISATTYTDEKANPYYRVKVKLDKHYVGTNENINHILPGMLVEGDINIGSKTVISYLLKPIHRSISSAFTEK